MRRLALALMIAVFAAGCAGYGEPFRPFPARNTDGRVGLVRNWKAAALNLYIKDEAGRLIEEWYLAPAAGPISSLDINQSWTPVTVVRSLPPGHYTVEIIPFVRRWTVLEGSRTVDLPRRSASISVGRDPLAVHDRYTGKHWGWILEIH